MNFKEYIPLAIRTAKPLPTVADNLLHAYLGIMSEVNELAEATDPGHIKEELADCMWYLALADSQINFGLAEMNFTNLDPLHPDSLKIMVVPGILKRLWVYGKDLDEALLHQLRAAFREIASDLLHSIEGDMEGGYEQYLSEALTANIEKLKLRYPNAYSDTDAEARADKGGSDCNNS